MNLVGILKNLLIIGFDPYMENEERETPVELSIKIGKKHLLVDLCKLITSEDRKLWTQKKKQGKVLLLLFLLQLTVILLLWQAQQL